MKELYLAGGCFWGMQAYFDNIQGVISTMVGYANGKIDNPTYEIVCSGNTGFAEAIKIQYDSQKVSLSFLLKMYYEVIDPTTLNRQGGDVGSQYRTGIYYVDDEDLPVIASSLAKLQTSYEKKIAIEHTKLRNFYPAEQYHQDYLKKNPGGYCHISHAKIEDAKQAKEQHYRKQDKEALKTILTPTQFSVTQENQTERPFQNEYWNTFEKGIYVDVTTGEPLFISSSKFDSGCGWPSFSKPIAPRLVKELRDRTHNMERIEVRSKIGDAHLGHVFQDGPAELGGMRYCINSASLLFIPLNQMEEKGYGEYIAQIEG